jgi:hypothetical protein
MSMYDLYPEIHQAVRNILKAEWENFDNKLHHFRGQSDREARGIRRECYYRRGERLADLQGLLNAALPAGIDAGFSGEAVLALLRKVFDAVETAVYWDTTFEGYGADDLAGWDMAAWCHLKDLSGLVWAEVEELKIIANVARAREGCRGGQEEWLPASEALARADVVGHPITLPQLSKLATSGKVKSRPRTLPGKHQLEVEWNTLAGHLLREAAAKRTTGKDGAEPLDGAYDDAIASARKEKQHGRPLD